MKKLPRRIPMLRVAVFLLAVCCGAGCSSAQTDTAEKKVAPVSVQLVQQGQNPMPIVVGAGTDERTKKIAAELAKYLQQISGAQFNVQIGDGKSGLAVGVAGDFPALGLAGNFKPEDPARREEYLLRSHAAGLYAIGATPIAAEHAVWDLLHRLGYRQYFPGPRWEIVPKSADLQIAVDAIEQPDYQMRHIWYGYGGIPERSASYEDWVQKNRATTHNYRGGVIVETGHIWETIVARNKAEFEAHPEYLCSNEPGLEKFCVSNPGLQKLVIDFALKYLEENPQADSISMEPSDGGGWDCDKCEDHQKFKNVTDRVVFLANLVAEAVTKKYPNKYVGIYAYNEHSPPPTIKVHPRVVVMIATVFIKGGYTIDQLLEGWKKQGVQQFGIREYYSVNPWDHDLPGKSFAGNLTYLQKTIPSFYAQGARFLTTESGDNWGPYGLGYYFAARSMWDVKEANRRDAIVDDFLTKSFGAAKEPMTQFFGLLDGSRKLPLSDDLIGRMFRALSQARALAKEPAVLARLDDLALYARYVELFHAYATAVAPARQKNFEELLRFSYRIRETGMVHTMALYRDLPTRDKEVVLPEEAGWHVLEDKNPWKSNEPFTPEQIEEFVNNGIANHKLLDFEPKAFSDKLVPATPLKLPQSAISTFNFTRDTHQYYVWIEDGKLALKVNSGRVYQNLGDTSLTLYSPAEATGKALDEAIISPDNKDHEVVLKTPYSGLHRLELRDTTSGTQLFFPPGLKVAVESSLNAPANYMDRWDLYFYVPKGTKIVGGWRDGPGQVVDADGKIVREFEGWLGQTQEYFSIPVAPGQDGRAWKFQFSGSKRVLMTVPPYLARSPQELLLPAEVVEADAKP